MKKSISFIDLVQTVAIVFGIGYGIVELSLFRAERSRQAALELAHSFETPAFLEGLTIAVRIPEGASMEQVVETYGEDEALLNGTGQIVETVGFLVWQGDLKLELVDQLLGGGVQAFWARTRPYWEHYREELARPSIAEWTQWLAERLGEIDPADHPPAYEAYKDWRS
ncbi:MAG: hypothetical protein P8174_11985 [Gemmatimonadota bacterium]